MTKFKKRKGFIEEKKFETIGLIIFFLSRFFFGGSLGGVLSASFPIYATWYFMEMIIYKKFFDKKPESRKQKALYYWLFPFLLFFLIGVTVAIVDSLIIKLIVLFL